MQQKKVKRILKKISKDKNEHIGRPAGKCYPQKLPKQIWTESNLCKQLLTLFTTECSFHHTYITGIGAKYQNKEMTKIQKKAHRTNVKHQQSSIEKLLEYLRQSSQKKFFFLNQQPAFEESISINEQGQVIISFETQKSEFVAENQIGDKIANQMNQIIRLLDSKGVVCLQRLFNLFLKYLNNKEKEQQEQEQVLEEVDIKIEEPVNQFLTQEVLRDIENHPQDYQELLNFWIVKDIFHPREENQLYITLKDIAKYPKDIQKFKELVDEIKKNHSTMLQFVEKIVQIWSNEL